MITLLFYIYHFCKGLFPFIYYLFCLFCLCFRSLPPRISPVLATWRQTSYLELYRCSSAFVVSFPFCIYIYGISRKKFEDFGAIIFRAHGEARADLDSWGDHSPSEQPS